MWRLQHDNANYTSVLLIFFLHFYHLRQVADWCDLSSRSRDRRFCVAARCDRLQYNRGMLRRGCRMRWLWFVLALFCAWSRIDTVLFDLNLLKGHSLFTELDAAFGDIPDPVFVMFGNSGFKDLIANFLCNMAQFESMHEHLFIAVSDNASAAYLRTFTADATIVVIDFGGMDEVHLLNLDAPRCTTLTLDAPRCTTLTLDATRPRITTAFSTKR